MCNLFLARQMLYVMDYLCALLESKAFGSGLIQHWPSPESLYPVYEVPADQKRCCTPDCLKRYCLSDICLTTYFDSLHYPITRLIQYSTEAAMFEEDSQLA